MNSNFLSTPGMPDPTASMGRELERLKSKAALVDQSSGEKRLKELKDTAQQFESLFTSYLLKVMRSTVDESKDEESNGFGKGIYQEMFDNEIALSISRTHGLGIAEMIYRQMADQVSQDKKKQGAVAPGTSSPAQVPAKTGNENSSPILAPVTPSKNSGGANVSSPYGFRVDPFTDHLHFHHGVDVAAPAGTSIKAAQSGRVVFSGQLGEYGNAIILEHDNGYRTLYGHAARNLVIVGEQVNEGQRIGMVGSTGRSTGPHLHFELQKEGARVDPATLGEAKLFALLK